MRSAKGTPITFSMWKNNFQLSTHLFRHYSTSAAPSQSSPTKSSTEIVTAITSTECKHVNNEEHLVQWFIHRKYTCGSLRHCDAGKIVSLVGWTDKKNAKFMQLTDGYGSTQILLENDELKSTFSKSKPTDLLLVQGRVLARPQPHVTRNNPTGEIELYAERMQILDSNVPYQDMLTQPNSVQSAAECDRTANVNEFTYRSHNCGELRETNIGEVVTLCGWLEFSRMKRFFTLRDGYGHTQVLIPEKVGTIFV